MELLIYLHVPFYQIHWFASQVMDQRSFMSIKKENRQILHVP